MNTGAEVGNKFLKRKIKMDAIFLFLCFTFTLNIITLFIGIYKFRSFEYDKDIVYISAASIACNFILTSIVLSLSSISNILKNIIL